MAPDFLGMTKEETAQFLRDQKEVLESKEEIDQARKQEEAAWAQQQERLIHYSDHFSHQEQQERKKLVSRPCKSFTTIQQKGDTLMGHT